MKYLRLFETHSAYSTYINGQDAILPNVSYCENENEVHYKPWTDPRLIAKFNVTSTTTPTSLFNNPSILKEIEIDGVIQPSVVTSYTFDTTGIHTVKYTLTDGTTSIDGGCFGGKSNMVSITIPSIITSIGAGVFSGCTSLTSITIPNSVTTIGTSLGNFDFEDVIFESINPNATFVRDATNKVLTNIAGDTLICGFNNTVAIPNTVTTIGDNAFTYCTGLTSVTIPDSVTTIGDRAFSGCAGLTSVTIGNGVTTIGQYAFESCAGLTSVTIPNSVTTIGITAFGSCSSLTSITSMAATAPTIHNTAFFNIKARGTLTVPSGSTGYDVWMGTGNYYLGKYNWTKVEQ